MENSLRFNNSSGDSLDDYKFTFESYLDYAAIIEADVSLPRPLESIEITAADLSLTQIDAAQPKLLRHGVGVGRHTHAFLHR
jgi:hypothetical protein